MSREDRVADYLPLTSVVFEILLALADQDRHGYDVMSEIERQTDGGIRPLAGTLYRAINRMLTDRLIEVVAMEESTDQRRRYYRLTGLGRAVARGEAERLSAAVAAARYKKVFQPEGA